MALVIAGERSGVGKTTVTLTLLAFLCRQGARVQSFKVGPDYIDPMFHQYVTSQSCRNLDPVLTSESYVQQCFERHTQNVDFTLVEGVMGLFDGISFLGKDKEIISDFASTAHISKLLNLPVLLVIDCSRLSGSVAAIAHGYCSFDPRIQIAGVVLNRVGSDRHLSLLQNALEPLQIPILGVLRREDNITIPDRHLGLVPTTELPKLDAVIDRLAHLGDTCFDWEQLLPLLKSSSPGRGNPRGRGNPAPTLPSSPSGTPRSKQTMPRGVELRVDTEWLLQVGVPPTTEGTNPWGWVHYLPGGETPPLLSHFPHLPISPSPVRVAVARDRAFNFYYQDNLDLLQQLGAELVFWSPLEDGGLPENIQGMYFGGGFPEVFAPQLAANFTACEAVKTGILTGIPTIAECGGLMYLCKQIVDFTGKSWSMVGILPSTTVMGKRLSLGYRRAVALQDSLLLDAGITVYGHEFHHSSLISNPNQPLFQTYRWDSQESTGYEGWNLLRNLHASYIHLHWGEYPELPQRFIQSCLEIVNDNNGF